MVLARIEMPTYRDSTGMLSPRSHSHSQKNEWTGENDDDPKQLRDNPARIAAHLNHAFKTDDLTTIVGALQEVLGAQNGAALARATG